MKKVTLYLIFLIITSVNHIVWANYRVRGETLSLSMVEKKFGESPFDIKKFAEGGEQVRAQMASALLKNKKQFIGKSNYQIRDTVGNFTGHYISGLYPTYMIYSAKDYSVSSWQIVFLIDAEGLVQDIVVHKNCCYN